MTWRVAKSLEVLRDQINALAPDRAKSSDGTIGDEAHSARSSDHNPNANGVVCAMDITNDPAHGVDSEKLAEHLRGARDPRIKYIISNRKIANSAKIGATAAWDWRVYNGTNPHNHHVHISVQSTNGDDTQPWDVALSTPEPGATQTVVIRPILRLGDKGDDVEILQIALNKKTSAKLIVDSSFGPATKKAVTDFQRKAGLVPDGIVGAYTWEELV